MRSSIFPIFFQQGGEVALPGASGTAPWAQKMLDVIFGPALTQQIVRASNQPALSFRPHLSRESMSVLPLGMLAATGFEGPGPRGAIEALPRLEPEALPPKLLHEKMLDYAKQQYLNQTGEEMPPDIEQQELDSIHHKIRQMSEDVMSTDIFKPPPEEEIGPGQYPSWWLFQQGGEVDQIRPYGSLPTDPNDPNVSAIKNRQRWRHVL